MRLWFRLLPSCGRDEARWYGHGVLAAVLFTHTNILQKEIRFLHHLHRVGTDSVKAV